MKKLQAYALLVLVGCAAGEGGGEDEGEGCIAGDQQLTETAIRDCVAGDWTAWRLFVCEPDSTQLCSVLVEQSIPCAEESRQLGLCKGPGSTAGQSVCLEDGSAWSACQILSSGPVGGLIGGGAVGCTPGSGQNCPNTCLYDGRTTCLDTREWAPCVCIVR